MASRRDPDLETIEAELVAVTRYALLIEYEDEEEWVPRSVVTNGETYDQDDCTEMHEFEIEAWKLDELGWA